MKEGAALDTEVQVGIVNIQDGALSTALATSCGGGGDLDLVWIQGQ